MNSRLRLEKKRTIEPGPLELAEDTLLEVRDLRVDFALSSRTVNPVDNVTFRIKRGETLAVVGESGSGKSVTCLSIMRLLPPIGIIGHGNLLYRRLGGDIIDLATVSQREMRRVRGADIAMIFQEPMTSLNPLYTIGDQIAEMILLHEGDGRSNAMARARQMLELVEIPAAGQRLNDYPHHMSGGMRQRVMIAMALACNPSLLIADEPTTALDVTIQAQILDLLRRLQAEIGMSILFVTHNLGVVAEIAHEVVVMYAGRVVEHAGVHDLFARPKHPYTKDLLECSPNPGRDIGADGKRRPLRPIPGSIPSLADLPSGCSYAPRCSYALSVCTRKVPPLEAASDSHLSRCLRHDQL